jgi:NAD(P)-dependent dehydrogenase (short-subunit alcohol dehydrogenase family)
MSDTLAIVVGAGGTIGGACARRLATSRDAVLCVDLNGDNLERTRADIHAGGGRAEVLVADAADPGFSAAVVGAAAPDAVVTAVVHAIAYEEHVDSLTASRESLLQSFEVGPLAAFTLFRDLLAAGKLDRGAALTAIGSLHATQPFPQCLAYNAAHGALAQIIKTLAHEWADRGLRVNAVVPGWIRTHAEVEFYGDEYLDKVGGSLPLGRFGTAEDIAAAVDYICSAHAAYVSGSFLTVDGALSVSLSRLDQVTQA